MIPILYSTSETSFTSNGLGRLTDCISCLVTEERNGIFECEFQYPVTGKLYNEMVTNGGIISVTHDDAKDRQPFDIYKYSAPIDGIVTFNARHISYRLSGITVKPFTAASCALALQGIGTNSLSTNPFSFWTDKAVTSTFTLSVPTSAKAILAGQQGSILDVYGKGEYKFDKFDVKLYTNRGTNSGVTIRYGKNLSDTLVEKDNGEYYNAIVPYWKGEDGTLVTLTGWYVVQTGETLKYCVPVDFSSEFQSQPTELELRTKATAYLANNTPWLPKENIKVDFVQLWNTDEYKDVAVLERVKLCDTVAIYYPALGLTNSSAKVIKVVYDTLLERYSSIELGEPQQTLAEAIIQPYAEAIASISDKASVSFMEEAIQAATDLIAGGLGGHVVINRNADGEPEEILIMDTDDTSTAVNVWRWNLNGLAHSHSGYNGPFDDIAITQDGKINASMITTGVINANLITAGTLSADRISGGTIDASDVTITNLNASNITSGTMSADMIRGGQLYIGGVNGQYGLIKLYDGNGNYSGQITGTQEVLTDSYTFTGSGGTEYDFTRIANILADHFQLSMTDSSSQRQSAFFAGSNVSERTAGSPHMNAAVYMYGKPVGGTTNTESVILLADEYYGARLSLEDSNGSSVIRGAGLSLTDSNGSSEINGAGLRTRKVTAYGEGIITTNATVSSVLDVQSRRRYATLSSAGWYRVMKISGNIGDWSFAVDFCVTRSYANTDNEVHAVKMLLTYGTAPSFVNENSKSNNLSVTAIRYTVNSNGVGYVDIRYDANSANTVAVDFTVHTSPSQQPYFTAESLQKVAESPSGETVLTKYTFAANTGMRVVHAQSSTSFGDAIATIKDIIGDNNITYGGNAANNLHAGISGFSSGVVSIASSGGPVFFATLGKYSDAYYAAELFTYNYPWRIRIRNVNGTYHAELYYPNY